MKDCWPSSSQENFRKTLISIFTLCIITSYLLGCLTRYYFDFVKIKVSVQVKSDRNEVHFNCGIPQSAQESAFLPDGYALEYVETIVHPAMLAHPNPLSVLILGGSQKDAEVQAILTEVFRHKSVKIVAVVASLHDKIYNPKADLVDEYNMCSHNTFTTNGKVENLQSLESLYLLLKNQSKHQISFQYSPFDVIILLHPFILFSDDDSYKFVNKHEYKMEQKNITLSTFQMLSQDLFMSRDGILVTHLGPSPNLNQKSKMQHIQNIGGAEHLQAEFIAQMTANTDFVDLHIFEDSNGASFHAPQSYIILCKGKSCRQHWYAEESYMTYQIKKRLLSYPSIIDGAMLLRYNRPPKAWERLFCSFPRNKRQCNYMNGFDPAIPNIYRHEFEVKQSSLGKNAGRGLFTKVDIAEGSYFMQEISVHPVRFSVHSTELIFNTRELIQEIYEGDDDDSNTEDSNSNSEDESGWYEVHVKKQEYKSELDSLLTFLEGYGYENDVFGASDSVDSGIGTFMNHGCNKTFNYGPVFYILDHKAGITESEYEYYMLTEEEANPNEPPKENVVAAELFNPLIDRHLDHYAGSYYGAITNISKGQELFTNYVYYFGLKGWKYGILSLLSQCHGETIGTVSQIEVI